MSNRKEDLEYCEQAIKNGSLSFHAASRLLPNAVRNSCLALYAFCRLADDEVDLKEDKSASVYDLVERLDKVYSGSPRDLPMDRAFARMVEETEMPRALPEALIEGLVWDAMERRYQTFDELVAYSARVASSVGVMMCVIMRQRDSNVLARACDLGVAMQLTNIARDIGEDAREGRLYIPLNWMKEVGVNPKLFLQSPTPTPEIRSLAHRLLAKAETLYQRSESGLVCLPKAVRPAMFSARHIYAAIGQEIRNNGFDSVGIRAKTSRRKKVGLLLLSCAQASASLLLPGPATLYAPALEQTKFLVDAAEVKRQNDSDWSDRFISILEQLRQRDLENYST